MRNTGNQILRITSIGAVIIMGVAACSPGDSSGESGLAGDAQIVQNDEPGSIAGPDVAGYGTLRFDDNCFFIEYPDDDYRLVPIFSSDAKTIQKGDTHGVVLWDGFEMYEDEEYWGKWLAISSDNVDLPEESQKIAERCQAVIGDGDEYMHIMTAEPIATAGQSQDGE